MSRELGSNGINHKENGFCEADFEYVRMHAREDLGEENVAFPVEALDANESHISSIESTKPQELTDLYGFAVKQEYIRHFLSAAEQEQKCDEERASSWDRVILVFPFLLNGAFPFQHFM